MEQQSVIQIPSPTNGQNHQGDKGLPFNNGFVPTSLFHEMISKNKVSHYNAEFSFEPYLKIIKDRSDSNCIIAKGMFESMKKRLAQLPDNKKLIQQKSKLDGVIPLLFPSLFAEGQMGFLSTPFTKEFMFMSPFIKDLFHSDDWEINICQFCRPRQSKTWRIGRRYYYTQPFLQRKSRFGF